MGCTVPYCDCGDAQHTTSYDVDDVAYDISSALGGVGSPVVGVYGDFESSFHYRPHTRLNHILPDDMDAYETLDEDDEEVFVTHSSDAWMGREQDILADIPDVFRTDSILSDDDIRSAVPGLYVRDKDDDPLAPSVAEVRGALNAVQRHARYTDNIEDILVPCETIYTDEDLRVYEDDTCYVLRDDDHEGLYALMDEAGVEGDLREAVGYCHSVFGESMDRDWSVSYPLVIVKG